MLNKKNIALTWGSTGWHIFPLISIYNFLKNKWNYNFKWYWEEDSLEQELSKKNNIEFFVIPAWKIRRYFDKRNFYEPLKNLTWIFFGIFYILKHKIDIIISKWGYVSIPLCIAWFILRKKIYIHESDAVWWIANKIVWLLATKIFYTFPNKKIDWKKHILSWQILNAELLEYITDEKVEENERLSVIVIWWSQWSTTIFKSLLKILPDLQEIDFQIILWEKNMHFREDFKKFPNTLVHDFVTQRRLGKFYKNTDIAITRAWATTLWELNMFWIHSIIIPLTNSAWNHQMNNALYFKENFESDVLDETQELELNLYKKIKLYKDLRKSWLNLNNFFLPLEIIETEINY